MKYLAAFFLSFLFALNICAQTEPIQNAFEQIGVEEIYLAKDDGAGEAGAPSTSFTTNDIPIYCVVRLDSARPAIVKMSLVAIGVRGVKPETKVVTVRYKTDGLQDRVNFTGKPDGAWIAGSYRVDVFLNDKLAQSKSFEIQQATGSNSSDSEIIKPFQPKTALKIKPGRRTRKY